MIEHIKKERKIIQEKLALQISTLYETYLEEVSQMWSWIELPHDTIIS
jgi:hypothetical protein